MEFVNWGKDIILSKLNVIFTRIIGSIEFIATVIISEFILTNDAVLQYIKNIVAQWTLYTLI